MKSKKNEYLTKLLKKKERKKRLAIMISKVFIIYFSVVSLLGLQSILTYSQMFDASSGSVNILNHDNMHNAEVQTNEDSAESSESDSEEGQSTFMPEDFLKDMKSKMLEVMKQTANISEKSILPPNFFKDMKNKMQQVLDDVGVNRGNLMSMRNLILNKMAKDHSSSEEIVVPDLGPDWFNQFQRPESDSVERTEFPSIDINWVTSDPNSSIESESSESDSSSKSESSESDSSETK